MRDDKRLRRAAIAGALCVCLCMPYTPEHSGEVMAQEADPTFLEQYGRTYGLLLAVVAVVYGGRLVMKKKRQKQEAIEAAEYEEERQKQAAEAERIAKLNTLEGKEVERIGLTWPDEQPTQPGSLVPLIATAYMAGGQELVTEGAGEGKTLWADYDVRVSPGAYRQGQIQVPADPREITEHKLVVDVASVHHEGLDISVEMPVSYGGPFVANFSGNYGDSGNDGRDGNDGSDGSDHEDGDGQDGQDGANGGQGQDGQAGESGSDVEAFATLVTVPGLDKKMLHVEVRSLDYDRVLRYRIDPSSGQLTIKSYGGYGGSGGDGGTGGDGGDGGDGSNGSSDHPYEGKGGNAGNGANGGDGGRGGNGGDGGRIILNLDPSAEAYKGLFTFENAGGSGGRYGSSGFWGSGGSYGQGDDLGNSGQTGSGGRDGESGYDGRQGPKPQVKVTTVTLDW